MFVTDDPVRVIREQLDRLRDEDRAEWSGPAQTDRAVQLTQVLGELEAETARAAGTWKASGAWMADGSRRPTDSLAWRGGRASHVARRILQVGDLLQGHDQTAKAVLSGELPIDHAYTLARALTKDRAEVYADYEAEFLQQATKLDHRDFHKLVATWVEVVDDLLDKHKEADDFEKRGLSVSQLLDGVSDLEGTLEPEGAALFRKVFDVFDIPDTPGMPGGVRSARQRRYDAVKSALALALLTAARIRGFRPTSPGDTTEEEPEEAPGEPEEEPVDTLHTHTRASIDVIVSYELLLGLRPAGLENLRSEIVGVGPVPPSLLRRLVAHSAIGRVIASALGVPLDVGRQVRFYNRNHRRALLFRDGRCIWPGCHLPGEWCDADHALDYAKGGRTAVTNGRFLCRRHHHLRDRGWQVAYDPESGVCAVTSPLGITYTSGPDPPR